MVPPLNNSLLAINITGQQIFKKVEHFEWSDYASVYAHGASFMMRSKEGSISFINKQNKNILVVHCILHNENLETEEIQNLASSFQRGSN